jgi:DNA-binding NtrC family response regulator
MNENKQTVLAIDDDITILTAIRKILENNYEVSLAKSADTALNILNNADIDLILLDVEMPAITGLAFMEFLRENNIFQYIPVIFVTSHAQQDIIVKAKKSGAKGFIVKPISADVILEKVKNVLEESRVKTDRDVLLKKLHLLEVACKTGKTAEADKLISELIKRHYNVGTDEKLIEIGRYIDKLDYALAVEKTGALIKSNLFEIKQG